MKSKTLAVFAVSMLMSAVIAGSTPQAEKEVLSEGSYTAKVGAIVCGGCGPLIKQTLQKFQEIDAVKVDSEHATVQFTVRQGNSVKLTDLQKALKAAADRMGMGADYELRDLKLMK